jgi:hypothetical protein
MAVENFLIPLLNVPQDFTISLNEIEYRIVTKYNDALEGGWVLDMYDGDSAEPIVMNIPMVTGCDLLEQYEHLNLGGKLIVFTDGDEKAVPTLDNLGVESNIYFQTGEAE